MAGTMRIPTMQESHLMIDIVHTSLQKVEDKRWKVSERLTGDSESSYATHPCADRLDTLSAVTRSDIKTVSTILQHEKAYTPNATRPDS